MNLLKMSDLICEAEEIITVGMSENLWNFMQSQNKIMNLLQFKNWNKDLQLEFKAIKNSYAKNWKKDANKKRWSIILSALPTANLNSSTFESKASDGAVNEESFYRFKENVKPNFETSEIEHVSLSDMEVSKIAEVMKTGKLMRRKDIGEYVYNVLRKGRDGAYDSRVQDHSGTVQKYIKMLKERFGIMKVLEDTPTLHKQNYGNNSLEYSTVDNSLYGVGETAIDGVTDERAVNKIKDLITPEFIQNNKVVGALFILDELKRNNIISTKDNTSANVPNTERWIVHVPFTNDEDKRKDLQFFYEIDLKTKQARFDISTIKDMSAKI